MDNLNDNYDTLDQFRVIVNITGDDYQFKSIYEIFTPTPFHYQISNFGFIGHGVDWIHARLLWPALIWALAFSFVRHFTKKIMSVPISRFSGLRGVKAQKFSYQAWLLMFYVLSSIYGWTVLSDKDWVAFPLTKNVSLNLFLNSPHTPSDDIRHYYSYEIGFYLAELVAIFVETKRSDFIQYVIHHIVTLCLVLLSWISYDHRIGTYVLLIHDLSDIFLSSAKLMHYLKWEIMVNINFILFTLMFFFFRLVCLPSVIYPLIVYNTQLRPANTSLMMQTFLLACVLQGLHIIWFYSVIKMIFRLIMGVKGDIRSDDEGDEETQKLSKSEKEKGVHYHTVGNSVTNIKGSSNRDLGRSTVRENNRKPKKE